MILCEVCGKEEPVARLILGEEEQILIGLNCFKERFNTNFEEWNSYKEMIDDLYGRIRNPKFSKKKRKEAKKMIDEIWNELYKNIKRGFQNLSIEYDSEGNIIKIKTA